MLLAAPSLPPCFIPSCLSNGLTVMIRIGDSEAEGIRVVWKDVRTRLCVLGLAQHGGGGVCFKAYNLFNENEPNAE
jgi:hypothetical protein